MLTVGALALLAAGAWYGHYWWIAGRFIVSTDDAYVGAKTATLAAKVAGLCRSRWRSRTTPRCAPAIVIARIDDGDYQLAVQTAARQDRHRSRRPSSASASRSRRKQAAVDQAKAQLASAQGRRRRAPSSS